MKNEILEKVYNARKNLIVNGDMQTGKTTNVMFPLIQEMIKNNESLIILDSKEEYLNKYYKELQDKNYNIVIINLKDFDKSEGWNPLECPYGYYKNGNIDKALDYLEKIGKTTFYQKSTNNPDEYWLKASADFFTGASLGLFEDGKEGEINLLSIHSIFDGENKKLGPNNYIDNYFKTKSPDSFAYIYASPAIFIPSSTKELVFSVANRKLKTLIAREKLNKLINKTTFSFNDIINKPTSVFLITNEENTHLNTLAAIFIEQLFSILMDSKLKNKFNFVLDNFDNIEFVNNLFAMLGSGITKNIKFSIVTRYIDQLYATYGDYLKSLCNIITVTNNSIDLVIDNKKQNIDNEYNENVCEMADIKYPQLKDSEIKRFSLRKIFMDTMEKRIKNLESNSQNRPTPMPSNGVSEKIDFTKDVNLEQIIKAVDDKIAELEKKEASNNNI